MHVAGVLGRRQDLPGVEGVGVARPPGEAADIRVAGEDLLPARGEGDRHDPGERDARDPGPAQPAGIPIDALQRLPARQREALVLRHWLGLEESETAAAMGISGGSVKTHTARGVAALTQAMEARR
ncbi:hypothetical protein GCM10010384_49580 [Streptomyces djakartensis]|uniref:RNA polymerase sigma factor 70 region 4 type 2 domain-containing protein n=1 Tax=Streptomyces djakartensis TaxID=68193 RepID=A0ABQ3A6J7_9ACTN|nr:hypothetical protein GCM10010384_49580 [Streptomyces djakartensis]